MMEGRLRYKWQDQVLSCAFPIGQRFSSPNLAISSILCGENGGERLTITLNPLGGEEEGAIEIKELALAIALEASPKERIFLNGYQSWTESREYTLQEKVRPLLRLARPLLKQYGDYSVYRDKRLHSWTYTYHRNQDGSLDFIGSLTEKSGFTVFEYEKGRKGFRLIIRKDCAGLLISGPYKAFYLFFTQGEENEVFDRYFTVMGIHKPYTKQWVGWTSWYNYYTRVTEEDILKNLEAFRRRNLSLDCFQIDDGYQNAVGDWLVINEKFPRGMGFLAERIKAAGYRGGLWLAPFVCERRSKLFAAHPDWVARDEKGRLIRAGYNTSWTGFFYALDLYNPEFRAYLREVFDTVLDKWGYDLVKLDFLYAATLLPRKDKTRGEVMCEAMEFLRELVGEKLILGCGVPLGAAFGLVDFCRIGGDISPKWEDRPLKALHYRERVSTINALTNTIGRRHLHGRAFLNDPDVFILRSVNQKLSQEQRYTLFLINLIFGGLIFTSDYIEEYSPEEKRLFQSIYPSKGLPTSCRVGECRPAGCRTITEDNPERPYIILERVFLDQVYMIYFTIKSQKYLAFCNLGGKAKQVVLPTDPEGKGYFQRKYGILQKGAQIRLEPYESRCFLRTVSIDPALINEDPFSALL